VHTAHDLSLMCARVTMTKNFEFCGGQCVTCRVQRTVRGRAIRRRLTTLVAVSDYIRSRHVEYGIVEAKDAVVLRLGADTSNARLRSPGPGRLCVGFIGALAPHKGVRTLLSVFEDAPDGWTLVVAGAGQLEREVARTVSRLPHVRFLGHVSGAAKEAFFEEIDVLAIPSEWEEPAALVGTEAAARGIPLVVSDRGGIPELPEARVFTARDAASLRDALAWYAGEPDRVETVSRRLLEHAPTLSWEAHASGLLGILDDAAGQPRTSSA
jgi:glycosyltransferase involved in cell wall biosynthesis